MFQIALRLLLLDITKVWEGEAQTIQKRGHRLDVDHVALTPGFLMGKSGKTLKSLSVNRITSKHCPIRRDLYMEVVMRREGKGTWGRIVGPLIEAYCKGLFNAFGDLYKSGAGLSYRDLEDRVESYTDTFKQERQATFDALEKLAQETGVEDDPTVLLLRLKYTAKSELAMLAADRSLRQSSAQDTQSLLEQVPIEYTGDVLSITPSKYLGIGSAATPDLIITNPPIVGDVKSGSSLERKHLYTCVGYALAYESQHKIDVNYGVIYFFETHTQTTLNSAQCYVIFLSDRLREEFLNERDDAYRVLQAPSPLPPLTGDLQKRYCTYCKYREECDKDRGPAQ